jgi:hypothetical protein
MLLTQFRNKDLEQSIPIMFGLQELRIEKATSNDIFFHTLIASYFQVFCSIYTNIPELKDEIEKVPLYFIKYKLKIPKCKNLYYLASQRCIDKENEFFSKL